MPENPETCVESIWIKNYRVQLLPLHQERYESAMKSLFPSGKLKKLRNQIDTRLCQSNDLKCRILFNELDFHVEYHVYSRQVINSFKIVETSNLKYDFKFNNREELDLLFAQRESADEIIIVNNDYVSDGYYYNLVFENHEGLFTSDTPLLRGVMRDYYLRRGDVKAIEIRKQDILSYRQVHFINALNPLGYKVVNL